MKIGAAVTPSLLVALAIGVAGYAYLVDRARVSDGDRAGRRADVFPSFRADEVRRVDLVHGSETLVLERDDAAAKEGREEWTMTAPRPDATDPAAIDALLRELEMATRVREVNDRDAVGLDHPRVRGHVRVGPIEYRFVVGDDAVTPEGAAYMRLEGEGTFVIERSIKVQLLRGADAYRERVLVPYGASEVARVELRPPSGTPLVLERRGTAFRIGGKDGLRASRAAVDHLLGALADVRAESFVDDAVATSALSEIVRTVAVTPRDPKRPSVSFVVAGNCPSRDPALATDVVVVRTAPTRTVACVAVAVTDALAPSPESLVDDGPFTAHADEMEELRIEPVEAPGADGRLLGRAIDVARRAGGWHERAPEERDLRGSDGDSTNALVDALASAHAVEVRRTEPGDRLVVRARATVVQTGGVTSEAVEVGAADASGTALARRLDDGAILRLPRAVARRFEPHPVALRGPMVWRPDVDAAAVVEIDDSCSRGPARVELADGMWKMRGSPADARSAGDLADAFARLQANAWIAESDDGTFGFGGAASCAVGLTLQTGPSTRHVEVTFGSAGDGGIYARAEGVQGVFVAPSSLRAMASHPVIDRRRIRVDPSTLRRVVVSRGAARIVLAMGQGGALDRAGSDAGVDAIERALLGLHAEWAVHAGAPAKDEGFDRPTLEIETTPVAAAQPSNEGENTRITVGAPTGEDGVDGYFARVVGVDATFLVSRAVVHAILDAW